MKDKLLESGDKLRGKQQQANRENFLSCTVFSHIYILMRKVQSLPTKFAPSLVTFPISQGFKKSNY